MTCGKRQKGLFFKKCKRTLMPCPDPRTKEQEDKRASVPFNPIPPLLLADSANWREERRKKEGRIAGFPRKKRTRKKSNYTVCRLREKKDGFGATFFVSLTIR